MKKKIIMIIALIVLIIVILLIAFLPKTKEEKAYTKKEIIERISTGFIDGATKKELESLLNQKISDETVITGKDAYLLQKPDDDLVKEYNLSDYVTSNETYYKNLENKIKQNYYWQMDESEENQNAYYITLKTYGYGIYLQDLETLKEQLLSRNINSSTSQHINEYKAKVIAMKILDQKLDDYIFDGEEKTVAITFDNINSDETKNSLIQYLIDLAGYNNSSEKTDNMIQNRESRMEEYINVAINSGTLHQNDILKI